MHFHSPAGFQPEIVATASYNVDADGSLRAVMIFQIPPHLAQDPSSHSSDSRLCGTSVSLGVSPHSRFLRASVSLAPSSDAAVAFDSQDRRGDTRGFETIDVHGVEIAGGMQAADAAAIKFLVPEVLETTVSPLP